MTREKEDDDMKRALTIAAAALLTASLGVSGAAAQSKMDKPVTDKPAMDRSAPDKMTHDTMTQKVEGTVKSVGFRGGSVTLDDGTTLKIPKSVMVPKGQLKRGAKISAEYQEKGGQKVATSLQILG